MQGCLPWFFAPNDVKVLHCDHTFELRSQESSLSLSTTSRLFCNLLLGRMSCCLAWRQQFWNFPSFMHPQLSMKRFCHVRAHHFLDLFGHFFCTLRLERKWQVKKIYGKMRMKFNRLVHPALCFPSWIDRCDGCTGVATCCMAFLLDVFWSPWFCCLDST